MLHLSLARFERRLDARRFVRIHRAHVMNLDRVTAFRRAPGGRLVAEMHDGTRLPVRRVKPQALRSLRV